jgi:Flp pilus assembly protein TadG
VHAAGDKHKRASRGASGAMRRVVGSLRGDESGVVAIIVALVMVVLLTVVALVVDLGGLYDHHRELQTAADAGALAGAQELVVTNGDSASATTRTREYVSGNTTPKSSVVAGNIVAWTPAVDSKSVTVDLRENHVSFLFAKVFGKSEGSVKAHAKAEVKYLTGVENVFPVALLLMNPERFRFVFSKNGTVLGSFDITDPDKDGVFDSGGGTLPSAAAGLYSVTLQAISTVDGQQTIGLELPNIGLWYVSNPSDPKELLYKVGMSRTVGGGTVSVQALVSPTVANDATIVSLDATLGGAHFTLARQGGSVFAGAVSAPTGTDNNTGYGTHDLVITFPATGGKGGKKTDVLCGRYIAFQSDVPLTYLMMTPSFYAGYSRQSGQEFQSATIVTKVPHMWDYYTMKLGNQAGSGLYSGNWRLADVFAGQNTRDEIGTTDPGTLDSWDLNTPLYIGGPLWPEAGAKVGQVWQGLDDRKANTVPHDDEAWRYVIVPFVNFDPDLHGTSKNYTIQMFAAFRISSYTDKGQNKGEIQGQFIRQVAPGTWQDTPPGPLYVETAVLTQ